METSRKSMTAREKIRRLVDVKEQAQREAQERYRTDPEIRAVIEELKRKNGARHTK